MSLKKVTQVKKDRGFKIFDLIVYGVIIVLIAVLFISLFATSDRSPLSGVRVCVDNRAVFGYDFEKDEYEILSDKVAVENGADKLTVTVTPHSGEKNVIVINKKRGTVKMTEANCHGKDCKYMPEIKDNSGIIYCSPHKLRIEPLNFEDNGNVIL